MKKILWSFTAIILILSPSLNTLWAQNPLILDQFTADPSARVFDGRVYVYPSHDIPCGEGRGIIGFCMADYHVFSSENLTVWTDHGVIISQDKVAWVDPVSYSLWAPDCIFRNEKYYFYFPATAIDKTEGFGRKIGVAVSHTPYGPFQPEPEPIQGVFGIDPNPFIDDDGQAYLYWAIHRRIYMAKLKENMLETRGEAWEIQDLPEKFKEGPFMFKRKDLYYLTYPYVEDSTERLVYSTADSPEGPFTYRGVIMDESPVQCWTNHQSIIEYQGQWYLFYHHNDLSPHFDKNRSICADSLFFNNDGTIRKVIPTLRGVGLTDARSEIQVDRYTAISKSGASIDFLDTLNPFLGWKTLLEAPGAWIQYNSIDFGAMPPDSVTVKVFSEAPALFEIRIDTLYGPVVAQIKTEGNPGWTVLKFPLLVKPEGVHNLFIQSGTNHQFAIDWIRFE